MRGGMGIGLWPSPIAGWSAFPQLPEVGPVLKMFSISIGRTISAKAAAAFATSNLSLVSIGAFAQALELIEAAGVGSVETEIAAHHAFMEDQAKATGI